MLHKSALVDQNPFIIHKTDFTFLWKCFYVAKINNFTLHLRNFHVSPDRSIAHLVILKYV